MKLKFNEQKVRDRILSGGYGKYDLIEEIITREEILSLKPRIVLKNITERLLISEDQINRKTFWSWLRRYKGNDKRPHTFHPIKAIEDSTVNSSADSFNQEWVKNFKPTMPDIKEREPVIIKIIRSDHNSNNQ